MQVPTKISGENPEISVLLSSDFDNIYKTFRCSVCGNPVFQYNEKNIRSIVPSGHPQTDRPGKIYQCNGTMTFHGKGQIYDILYQVMDATFNLNTVTDIRAAVGYLSEESNNKFNTRCKARYYVS